MVERVETGIHGLDDMIEGGFPKTSVTLVSGGPGTGKTLFCSQFLWHGIQNGENGLFITMEEQVDDILEDAAEFGWDFEEEMKKDSFHIEYINPFRVDTGFEEHVKRKIDDIGAERVVIDSTSVIGMYADSKGKIRRRLYELINMLKKNDVTCIMTAESPRGEEDAISRYGIEEFITDSVVVLDYMGIGGGVYRNIEIPKIRKTNQAKGSFPMRISDEGMRVFQDEEEYVESMD